MLSTQCSLCKLLDIIRVLLHNERKNYRWKEKIQDHVSSYLICCEKMKNLDSKTLKAYRIDLNQFFSFLNSGDLLFSKESIGLNIERLHDSFKPKTVKRKISSIKAFSSYCENERFLSINPFHTMKLKYKEPLILPKTKNSSDVQAI